MIAKEVEGMGPCTIIDGMPPLPMDAGNMIVSRIELKRLYRNPETSTKNSRCWHEPDARTTDAAVELLGLMWTERGAKLSGKEGDGE